MAPQIHAARFRRMKLCDVPGVFVTDHATPAGSADDGHRSSRVPPGRGRDGLVPYLGRSYQRQFGDTSLLMGRKPVYISGFRPINLGEVARRWRARGC